MSERGSHSSGNSTNERRRSEGKHGTGPVSTGITRRTLAIGGGVVAVAAVAGVGGRFWYVHRPIPATVADTAVELEAGTTYDALVTSGALPLKKGDLVAVDETTLITAGAGANYHIYNGDVEVDPAEVVARDAVVTGKNGENLVEEYDTSVDETQCTVEISGEGAIRLIIQKGTNSKIYTHTGKQSGISVQGDESVIGEPYQVKAFNGTTNGNLIALTFDDGPSVYTPGILDVLKEKNVKGTFFMLGENVATYPDVAKRVADEGHQLATHSWDHPNMFNLSAGEIRDQMERCVQAIKDATGKTTSMMRAPYGNWSAECWAAVCDFINCEVYWNIDTLDWKRPGANGIAQNFMAELVPGAVSLMHDGGGNREQDIAALPGIIDQCIEAGYRFVTMDELIAAK